VHLSPLGREQVERMVERVAGLGIESIYVSPVDRCRETAEVLARRLKLGVEIRDALAELDYGGWTGRRVAELREEELFRRWNAHRAGTRIPGGELMLEVQLRIVQEMIRLREMHDGNTVALVTHGDVIKAAAAYALGTPLDLLLRIEISLASVTVIAWGEYGPWVLTMNSTPEVAMRER
jgi:broad specificity phosphatase PhoE